MTLLEKIDKLIAEQGLSRHKVEKEAGLSVSTLLKWDNSVPRADKLKAVADVLGVSVDYLLSDEEGIEVRPAPQNELGYDFVLTDGKESTFIEVESGNENYFKECNSAPILIWSHSLPATFCCQIRVKSALLKWRKILRTLRMCKKQKRTNSAGRSLNILFCSEGKSLYVFNSILKLCKELRQYRTG